MRNLSFSRATVFFLFLLVSLCAASAQVETFSVSVEDIKSQIIVNETAIFNITISNGYSQARDFKLNKAGYPFWDMHTDPIRSPITVTVPGRGERTITLYVRPLHITAVDTYNVDTSVEDLATGREQRVPITVGIRSTEPLIKGYRPTVLTSVGMPETVDPRENVTVTVNLNNQNLLDYPAIQVRLSSDTLNGEYNYTLGPKETKTVTITEKLDDMTLPQEDRLVVALFRDGRSIINPIVRDFEVEQYVAKQDVSEEKRLLKRIETMTVTSNNPDYDGLLRVETTFFENLVTSTDPNAARVEEDGQRYLVWNVDLDENNEMAITIERNYRPLVIILLVIGILIGLYFVLRSPLVITKEIASVSGGSGGITEIKVLLKLRNRGKKTISDIEVADVVPRIASVEKELAVGSLQPDKVTHHAEKGTILKWNIETLEAEEGVVLTYRMKSRLSIVGEFTLPSATARFKYNTSYVVTNSNRTLVTR